MKHRSIRSAASFSPRAIAAMAMPATMIKGSGTREPPGEAIRQPSSARRARGSFKVPCLPWYGFSSHHAASSVAPMSSLCPSRYTSSK